MPLTHYKGTSLDRVVDLIKFDNPDREIIYGVNFTLGPPRPASTDNFRNTSIRYIPKTSEHREQTLRLRRLSLSVLQALDEFHDLVEIELPTSTHKVLDKINAALGLDLIPEEVEDTPYLTLEDRLPLRILSDTSSYAWVRSSHLFKVRYLGNYRLTTDGSYRKIHTGTPRVTPE